MCTCTCWSISSNFTVMHFVNKIQINDTYSFTSYQNSFDRKGFIKYCVQKTFPEHQLFILQCKAFWKKMLINRQILYENTAYLYKYTFDNRNKYPDALQVKKEYFASFLLSHTVWVNIWFVLSFLGLSTVLDDLK